MFPDCFFVIDSITLSPKGKTEQDILENQSNATLYLSSDFTTTLNNLY